MTELVEQILEGHNRRYSNSILPGNITVLNKFDETICDFALSTRDLYIRVLSMMTRKINKPFKQIANEDIISYLANLKNEDGSEKAESTKEHIKIVIVMFFRWLYKVEKGDKSPPAVRGIKWNNNAFKKNINPNELWTDEGIKRIVEECPNSRDRAFVTTLYDSGARIGELLSMDIEHVTFEDGICYIYLPESKTESRKVGLLFSTAFIQDWLDNYPKKLYRPKSPLWISFSPHTYGQRMKQNSTFELLNKIKNNAGIDKKINHHILRHSRISICRKAGMPDALNRRRHGHAPGSQMIERYTWINDEDAFNGYVKAMGYPPKKPIRPDPAILKPHTCNRCGAENPATNHYCKECASTLNLVERDISLLEVMKSNFVKLEGINVDNVLKKFQQFKAETRDIQKVFDCFNGGTTITNDVVQKALGLGTDACLAVLSYLLGAEMIDLKKDQVILRDRNKYEQFLQMHKRYIEPNVIS